MAAPLHNRTFLLLVFFLLAAHVSFSQQLTFCESVDSKGKPQHPSTSFIMHPNGGSVNVLVTLTDEVNSSFVTYDLYRYDSENKEAFENTIRHTVQPNYTWFRQEITFHKEGVYNVYVYNDRDRLLCAGKVTIKIQ